MRDKVSPTMDARKLPIRIVLVALILVSVTAIAPAASARGSAPLVGKVLVPGARIHSANGIMFDSQDRLYIASIVGREILVMDPGSGQIIDRLGPADGVDAPDDVAFGPDGSLYWTSLLTGHVGRRTPQGEVHTQFVALGVNPITLSDDGRLFVALDFLGDGLYELDPELAAPPRSIVVSTSQIPLPLGFLNGLDWGPDGRLYGPLWTRGWVVSIDVDSCHASSDPWSDCDIQTIADGLGIPAAVKFDSQGRLHVVDHLTGEVLRIDTLIGSKSQVAQLTPGLDNLAFDSSDQLFVSHTQDGSIVRVLPSGQTRTVREGGLIAPGGIAVLPGPRGRDAVFVADVLSMREFDGLTGELVGVTRNMIGFSEFVGPFTLAADGDKLVSSSWFAGEVQVWDPATGEAVVTYHHVPAPLNAIGFQGDVAIAQLLTGSVVRASDGVPLATGLYVPAGLAASGDDLWVGDWATGMVWKYTSPGVSPAQRTLVAQGLSHPEGLAIDRDGSLLVVEAGVGQLSRIDPATGTITPVADGLVLGAPGTPGMPPTWLFNGVAVGPSGAIYVTGDVGNVVYRFRSDH